ncbi:PEP synthetase regulatory protein, partial [Pseudomonas aeruginosa M10]
MKRTAFFISDGTGITAETLGQSLLAQFENISFVKLTRPYIDTEEKARAMVQQINNAAESDGARPIIFDTIVNRDIRAVLAQSNGFMIDIFATFLSPLEQELSADSSYSVGKSHSIGHNSNYMDRIEAVNFALDNDDGARTHYYDKADLILVGVSRCGKTPTCLYMALQYGIRAANYPLTEEDMERLQLPNALKQYKHKLFGLTI